MELTHVNAQGEAHMVDVGAKAVTAREAVAESVLIMQEETLSRITAGDLPKGDVFAAARIAGIMAAKNTSLLIPLCHPIALTSVEVSLKAEVPCRVRVIATVRCLGQTGVEMEALTAASVTALTVYDMCKAVDRGMEISSVRLLEKSGGKSGRYVREARV